MKIQQLKKELGLTNKDLAEFLGLNYISFMTSSAKKRYEKAFCEFYKYIKRTKIQRNDYSRTTNTDNI